MIYVFNAISKKRQALAKRIARQVLSREGAKKDLAIVFLKEKEIQQLNRRYRHKNQPTDVLAFESKEKANYLGEVVICLDWVRKNAKTMKISFELEWARVLIHGVLHLLGYDHEKGRAKAEKMFKVQEKYLKTICFQAT